MIRLGHIEYSNCVPLHAPLLGPGGPAGIEVVHGVPTELNRALAEGRIDVAPCSSIEFARNPGYRILPGLAIASVGPVRSILFESAVDLSELDGAEVAVPTASATSVVLLRALLELRLGVRPRLVPFDQEREDPVDGGAAAALRIGDTALKRHAPDGRRVLDLGEAWTAWTGLPFAFAVWLVRPGQLDDARLGLLHRQLLEQRDRLPRIWPELAHAWAPRLGLDGQRLVSYWSALNYHLDEATQRGFMRFLHCAAELGEAPHVSDLSWYPGS